MNYYQFHIGDYAVHTRHLSLMEDLVYRRLLDWYYTNEQPISLDVNRAAKLIGMQDYTAEVSEILSNFFLKSEDGYRSKRCDEEIEKYQAKAERAKQANNKRWESKTNLKSYLKSDPNQEPITNNQEPIKNNRSTGVDRFPEFWSAYPKHVKQKPSREIWKRKKLDDHTDKILKDISERLSSDCRWRDGFIPDPTTYLNQERWDDEIDTGGRNAHQKPPQQTDPRSRVNAALDDWLEQDTGRENLESIDGDLRH